MKSGKRPRPLLLFYILVTYVLLQFVWWAFLLIRLDNEATQLQYRIIEMEASPVAATLSTSDLLKEKIELDNSLHKKWMMIVGEGSVFLVLLCLGILRTRNSFKKEAALAARQKNFLLSVTHELRSPLASVRLQLETIQKRPLQKEKQEEVLANAIEDTDRLNALVENILVATQIDNHTYSVTPEKGDLSAAVETLTDKAATTIARHHRITKNISSGVSASFDPVGFHSIFWNLVENAAKYSKQGTEIVITLQKKKQAAGNEIILLSVADRGPGISNEEKENVFNRFYRIGNEETRSTRGTGLGLYIVRSLADAHGWNVKISDHAGGGSIFEIIIPV